MYRDAYLETEILSASPVRLVELLYRGAVEASRQARCAVDAGNIAERNRQITRAQAILSELALSLDHDRGGGISRDLVELYDYMQRRLNDANANQAGEPIDEVRRLLETLLDAWTSISASQNASMILDSISGLMTGNDAAGQFSGVDFEATRVNSLA